VPRKKKQPTLAEQLKAAIKKGDTELAIKLTDQISEENKKPIQQEVIYDLTEPEVEESDCKIIDLTENKYNVDENSNVIIPKSNYITTTRKVGNISVGKGKQMARRIPMEQEKHLNTWKDTGNVAVKDIEFDKKHPAPIIQEYRDPVVKYKVRCSGCGRIEILYGSQLRGSVSSDPDDEGTLHYCNRCCCRGGIR
jgi:hypothetical protein